MSITLTIGLTDLARELGENGTVQTTSVRIRAYNDAMVEFFSEKKFPFAIKLNTAKTTIPGVKTYSIADIADMRSPGGIHEIYLGSNEKPHLPIDWTDRNNRDVQGGMYFCMTPDGQSIQFLGDITTAQTINIWHYYIPARIEDITSSATFPIPERYRKTVSTLAAAYVQWSRYLDAQGNRLFNLYTKMIGKTKAEQSERHTRQALKFPHYLKRIGFRRTVR